MPAPHGSIPRKRTLLRAFAGPAGSATNARCSVRVGPARHGSEGRVSDAPRPRLRVARQVGHVHDAADDATLEHGDAIGARLGLREGALPGDVGVGHCHARANFQTGSLVALFRGTATAPGVRLGTAAAIPGSSHEAAREMTDDELLSVMAGAKGGQIIVAG